MLSHTYLYLISGLIEGNFYIPMVPGITEFRKAHLKQITKIEKVNDTITLLYFLMDFGKLIYKYYSCYNDDYVRDNNYSSNQTNQGRIKKNRFYGR